VNLHPPPLRFALQAVHGAVVFDLGDRVHGLAELQRASSDFGDHEGGPEQCTAMAMGVPAVVDGGGDAAAEDQQGHPGSVGQLHAVGGAG